jgi:small subunit ribosomal protein S6
MKLYEIDYLIPADISKKEVSSLNEEIQAFIKKEGGSIRKFSISPEKRLAYPIEKKIRAFLVTIILDSEGDKIKLITKQLKDRKEIIRYLVLNKKDIVEEIREERKEGRGGKKEKKELTKIVKPVNKKKDKVELKEIEEKLEKILHE